jgi:hypothetical protein
LLGVVKRSFQGSDLGRSEPDLPMGFEIIEGQVGKLIEVAEPVQPIPGLLLQLPFPADADLQFTEIWMADRQVLPEVAYATTDLAVWIPGVRCLFSLR